MTVPSAHQVDVFAAFLTIIGWLFLLLLLEQVEDPRVRWARLASFGPLHQAYDRLPREWGLLHAVLLIAATLWLGAVLVPTGKLRPRLLIATATCLTFLATAWALHPEHSLASAEARGHSPAPPPLPSRALAQAGARDRLGSLLPQASTTEDDGPGT